MKKTIRRIVATLLVVALMILGVCFIVNYKKIGDDSQTNVESNEVFNLKNHICDLIDEGNNEEVGRIFAEGQVSESLYQELISENKEVLENVLVNSMSIFEENSQYFELTSLRARGYINDSLFEAYWKVIGCEKLAESSKSKKYPNVDMYLLADMERICSINEAAFYDYVDIWEDKIISDELYNELCKRLELKSEIEEKEIERLIDQGNFEKIGDMMYQGKLDKQIFDSLYEESPDMMADIVSHILLGCAENNDALKFLTLRVKGYISDDNFDCYWQEIGFDVPKKLEENDVDMRLIYELERMIEIDMEAEILKNRLMDSDLLDEESKKVLISLL